MPIATSQFTIIDLNDVVIQATAPVNPVVNMLWLDTGIVPNMLKRWSGSTWVKVSDTDSATKDELANDIQTVTNSFNTIIDQSTQQIRIEVSETYSAKSTLEEYKNLVSTQFAQTSNDFTFLFHQLEQFIQTLDDDTQTQFIEITRYIRFVDGNIVLGEVGNQITLVIQNDRISFLQSGAEVAYFSNNRLYVYDGQFINSLRLGNFAFIPRSNGSLDFKKVG